MQRAVWQWIHGSRHRRFVVVGILFVSMFSVSWFWSDFCLWRADVHLVLRHHALAEQWIDRAQWGRKLAARTVLLRLRLARRMGRFQEIPQLLRQAQQAGVPKTEIQREQWLAMAQAQQFDEVSAHWTDLLADPRDDEPEIARSFVVWASSRHLIDDALRVLKLWEQDYPDNPEPFALHGQVSQAMNDDAGAIEAYRKALALAPANGKYRLALATALEKRLQLDEAVTLFQECVQQMPDDLAAIRGLAETYASRGELERALSTLLGAMKRFPDDVSLHQSLGEVYLAQGDAVAAVPHLERIHAAQPENADIAYSLARALKAVKRESEAAELFEFVAESRQPLDSLKSLEERLAKHPGDSELLLQIASISAKYKSRAEAIRWLEKLLLITPNYRPAHLAISELYELTGQPEKAATHRKLANSLDSNRAGERRTEFP